MCSSIKLAVLVNSLEGGGAERIASMLASELAGNKRDWQVTLVLLDDALERYVPTKGLAVVRLGGNGSYWDSFLKLYSHLKHNRYSSILSFLTRANCLSILLKYRFRHSAVISERGDPNNRLGSGIAGWAKRSFVRILYPRAESVIPVSHGLGYRLVTEYGVKKDRLSVIHNPIKIPVASCTTKRSQPSVFEKLSKGNFIVALGRLQRRKGFDLLISAFSESDYGGDLVILGEGPERAPLQQLSAALSVSERVYFPGFVDDPAAITREADAFVLSARGGEGFPNALAEAMAVGCPVLATNCEFGPAEILEGAARLSVTGVYEAKYGLLVPVGDIHHLRNGINTIVRPERRAYWSERASARSVAFSVDATVNSYVSAIFNASARSAFRPKDAGS